MAAHRGFKPEYAEQAYKLCLLGLIDEQIAKYFGVSEKTLYTWQKKYPELRASMKEGKVLPDANVAHALYKRACGFEHPAVKIFQYQGRTYEHAYTEKYPPESVACIFYLKNRRPDLWRDHPSEMANAQDQVDKLVALAKLGPVKIEPQKPE